MCTLLDYGANVSASDVSGLPESCKFPGNTPLHWAVIKGVPDAASTMQSLGCNLAEPDDHIIYIETPDRKDKSDAVAREVWSTPASTMQSLGCNPTEPDDHIIYVETPGREDESDAIAREVWSTPKFHKPRKSRGKPPPRLFQSNKMWPEDRAGITEKLTYWIECFASPYPNNTHKLAIALQLAVTVKKVNCFCHNYRKRLRVKLEAASSST
ncbi:hypothetical protein T484DRAFT_1866752 [Baffinella frigidus]|nr:hypothetical protein T484DRAFT_1866752 [Cryptophyta sp. CCMP2293]